MGLKVGITGGIGSGKSTLSKFFEVLGIPVYYADDAAKKLMNSDTGLKEKLCFEFGKSIYTDGVLNRQVLAGIVFNDEAKLATLNAIVHPATIADAENWMQKQKSPYTIKEAALIFESEGNQKLDKVIGVFCEEDLRIKRVMLRDNTTKEKVLNRLNKQMKEEEKMRLCNYIITNNDMVLVIPQVLKIHEDLLKLASSNSGKS